MCVCVCVCLWTGPGKAVKKPRVAAPAKLAKNKPCLTVWGAGRTLPPTLEGASAAAPRGEDGAGP